jgi:pantothenate kinase
MKEPELLSEILKNSQCHDFKKSRFLVAISGIPGSGKSTLSHELVNFMEEQGIADIQVLPMDGFHLCKSQLNEEGLKRRGAPWTFDSEKFVKVVQNAKFQLSPAVLVPSFDHSKGDPIEDDICINSNCKVVVVEGNYLFLNEKPWSKLIEFFDFKVFIDCPLNVANDRLVKRHVKAGLSNTPQEAQLRVNLNDLPNSRLILDNLSQLSKTNKEAIVLLKQDF